MSFTKTFSKKGRQVAILLSIPKTIVTIGGSTLQKALEKAARQQFLEAIVTLKVYACGKGRATFLFSKSLHNPESKSLLLDSIVSKVLAETKELCREEAAETRYRNYRQRQQDMNKSWRESTN